MPCILPKRFGMFNSISFIYFVRALTIAYGPNLCFYNSFSAIDSSWRTWISWSSCSRTCGTGVRSRSRRCNIAEHGGSTATCTRTGTDTEYCNRRECLTTTTSPPLPSGKEMLKGGLNFLCHLCNPENAWCGASDWVTEDNRRRMKRLCYIVGH